MGGSDAERVDHVNRYSQWSGKPNTGKHTNKMLVNHITRLYTVAYYTTLHRCIRSDQLCDYRHTHTHISDKGEEAF